MRCWFSLLFFVPMVAVANDPPQVADFLSKSYHSCMDRSGGVTSTMMDCFGAEYDRQDKTLNANYQQLIKLYGAKSVFVGKLRAAQRLWGPMVEADVGLMMDPDGGSSEGLVGRTTSQNAVVYRREEFAELRDVKRYGINTDRVRTNLSFQTRECTGSKFSSGMECDARSLSRANANLQKSLAKLLALPNRREAALASQKAWTAYSRANCEVLVAGRIYAAQDEPMNACLEDATRRRSYFLSRVTAGADK